ncbi:MAG: hypothetical protein D6776_08845 [Planctomycetota bacterium]|nr:MAG: hypothetical protein D6776_08845 [Planctomycetota bacterium]
MARRGKVGGLWLVVAIAATSGAWAQGGLPGMPSPEQIERRIAEEMEKLPERTVTDEVFEIRYKPVPIDLREVARRAAAAAAGQLPQGVSPEQAAKQLLPMARPYIERAYGEIGTLQVKRPVAYRSKRLEPGEYLLGLILKGDSPIGIRIHGAKLERELRIPFRGARSKQPHPELKLEVEVADKRRGKRYIVAWFLSVRAKAGKFVPKDAK